MSVKVCSLLFCFLMSTAAPVTAEQADEYSGNFTKRSPTSDVPQSIALAVDSWENVITRFLFWKSVNRSDIRYICFSSEEIEGEAGCVCRGPKMYGTPENASDDLFKFIFYQDDQSSQEQIEEKAKIFCKPAGVIFG